MKILITGGHITPALAVADELHNNEVLFVGREYALSSDRVKSFEYEEVKRRGYRFMNISAGRLTRTFSLQTFLNILKIPFGFISALLIMHKEEPKVVLTFGGYIALPIAVAAYLHHIPIVTHEQTIRPGSANRFIARLARKVFVSFPEAQNFFPPTKVVVSGNPIRDEVRQVVKKIPHFTKNWPVLFITGGSLGSHDINTMIFSILPELLKSYIVIHQTGAATEFKDNDRAKELKNENYFSFDHIESDLIGFVYEQADLVVGRAGANTVFELLALKKPSILIPLPWSAFQEQQKHADYLKGLGVARVFDQSNDSKKLLSNITNMFKDLEMYRKNFDTIKLPYDPTSAAKQIAQEVLASTTNIPTS